MSDRHQRPAHAGATRGSDVQVMGLTKLIHGREVLSDVSVTVSAGMTVGLSGANGSGKTMLMRAILGLIRPSSGKVCIDGQVMWRDISFPPSVGVLLEGPAFLSSRSGLENLTLLASVRNIATHDECVLALAGIAAAVLEHPDLIVLDEPTNALDASGIEMVKGVVRREQRRGATIILACHSADILRDLSHEIYHMAEGHVDGHEVLDVERKIHEIEM